MGYETNFEIDVDVSDEQFREAARDIPYLSELDGRNYGDFISGKWYDHVEDLRLFSKNLGNVLVTVHGDGENDDDLWVEYYYNGKMQHEDAVITYGAFDKANLE